MINLSIFIRFLKDNEVTPIYRGKIKSLFDVFFFYK